ncbi:OLC1v1030478C1 [Oldenlandia corymbosa var. corymbosa]|uniref:OLC1v1030478C1 n=1 Tax=Oldenlandia corymbosa var. corymbosa TaxID=529605 RepID=A0AAV1CGX3_OLDCO|nr:OLC1v1030478C1 [Oldenlandia corymbosa var. corymbosa]
MFSPVKMIRLSIIHQALFDELWMMLDPRKQPSFIPKKGKSSIVLFGGKEDSRKTMACLKYAYYNKKKGWEPALVCVSKYSADTLAQLREEATKVKYHVVFIETRESMDEFEVFDVKPFVRLSIFKSLMTGQIYEDQIKGFCCEMGRGNEHIYWKRKD